MQKQREQLKAKRGNRGFSLIELMVVVFVLFALVAIAVINILPGLRTNKANAAMDALVTQMRYGRELAISMRRNVLVTFTAPNKIQLAVQTLNGEAPAAPIAPVYLNDNTPGGLQFYVFPNLPDVPGGVGNSQAINWVPANGASAGLSLIFNSSGTFVGTTGNAGFSTVGNNNPVNGTIFIGLQGDVSTARAITILGATGRVRTYYYTGGTTPALAWHE